MIVTMEIADLRKRYEKGALRKADLDADPYRQFSQWFEAASRCPEIIEPNAMTLSTADGSGKVAARTVLLKGVDAKGFRFFTNYQSRKGRHLAENPHASLLFFWPILERQISIGGRVQKLSREESEAYFISRPEESRIGAWASQQSSTVPDREFLEHQYKKVAEEFRNQPIPMPPAWGGYLLEPEEIEFWQGRPGRLHDRLIYRRTSDHSWAVERLSP